MKVQSKHRAVFAGSWQETLCVAGTFADPNFRQQTGLCSETGTGKYQQTGSNRELTLRQDTQ